MNNWPKGTRITDTNNVARLESRRNRKGTRTEIFAYAEAVGCRNYPHQGDLTKLHTLVGWLRISQSPS